MAQQARHSADAAALLRRQAVAAARSLLSPATYLGNLREAALIGVHVATYPLGLLPGPARQEPPLRPRHLGDRALLTNDPETACTPVVQIHGYVHNRSAFLLLSRSLARAGFQHIHGLNYNPVLSGIPQLAGLLAAEVERVLEATGAERCQIVGHSLGGIIARYYVQQLGGEDTVDTVVTLAAPHHGTYSAYLGAGPAVHEMRPGSRLLRELDDTARPSPVRWIAFYSDLDLLVTPAVSAKLTHPALQATNIKVRSTGHLSLLLSRPVLTGVVDHLVHRDRHRPDALPGVSSLPTEGQLRRRSAAEDDAAVSPGRAQESSGR
jgi:triacylglycerol lipase